MNIASRENVWFKFKLTFVGSKLNPLKPPEYLHEKRMVENQKGEYLGIMDETIELNIKVYSQFESEFICTPLEVMKGSDVQQCFCYFLFPLPKDLSSNNNNGNDSMETPYWCTCREDECIYLPGHDYYDKVEASGGPIFLLYIFYFSFVIVMSYWMTVVLVNFFVGFSSPNLHCVRILGLENFYDKRCILNHYTCAW